MKVKDFDFSPLQPYDLVQVYCQDEFYETLNLHAFQYFYSDETIIYLDEQIIVVEDIPSN